MGFKARDLLLTGLIVVVVVIAVIVGMNAIQKIKSPTMPGTTISSAVQSAAHGNIVQSVVGTYKSWGPTIVLENDGKVYGDYVEYWTVRKITPTWKLNGNIVNIDCKGDTRTLRLSSDGKSLIGRDGTVFIKQ